LQEFLMTAKAPEITDRKPRADAQRNRERILEVAKQEFTRSGANASLEEIAKRAGVGPETLYRHFPTREDLLVAVYRPVETKQIIAPVLNALIGDPKKVFEASYAQIHAALRALVKRAVKSGDIRKDLTRSTFFAHLSASPMSRPALTGSNALEGWSIFLLPVQGHLNKPKDSVPLEKQIPQVIEKPESGDKRKEASG
jgi:AcrR family transcriptional regulator